MGEKFGDLPASLRQSCCAERETGAVDVSLGRVGLRSAVIGVPIRIDADGLHGDLSFDLSLD